MRINHNITAMNSARQLGGNQGAMAKNLEKLSSGYRINRAGDDAAGLAISEKMRASIKGLDTAKKNSNDGISLVQTAEGALTEVHSMLNRMVELATQSANGTYDNEVDRKNLQEEINSLKSEVNRISESTNYNGINLLDGSLGSVKGLANAGGMEDTVLAAGATGITVANTAAKAETYKVTTTPGTAADGDSVTIKFNADGKSYELKMTAPLAGGLTDSNVAAAINGTAGSTIAFADDAATKDALKALKANFTVDGTAGLKFTAKEAGANGDVVTGISFSVPAEYTSVVDTANNVSGRNAGYTLAVAAGKVTEDGALTIGDKTIELKKDETTADVLTKLQSAGLSAAMDKAANTIYLETTDAVKTESKNVSLGTTSEDAIIKSQTYTKGTYVSTFSAAAAGEATATINYTDADGNKVSKEIKYTPAAATGAAASTALAKAINEDATLKELFTADGTTAAFKITNNTAGANAPTILGISSSDATLEQAVVVTEGTGGNTELKMQTGEQFKSGDTITVNGKTYEFTNGEQTVASGNTAVNLGDTTDNKAAMENLKTALEKDGITATLNATSDTLTFDETSSTGGVKKPGGLTLQVGETAEAFNQVTVSVGNMNTKNLGIADIDISTQAGAKGALDKIKSAINNVSGTRGALGAVQNRLEHTINNLGVASENITAAESRIRDVDVAQEMMDFTKNNILSQAAQAMLAQANQIPQGVLQLLG